MLASTASAARRSLLLLGLFVAAIDSTSMGAVAPAGAQTPPGPTTTVATTPPVGNNPSQNTWSISPTGKDPSQPSDRKAFTYELAPGSSVDDSATVWNYSDAPRIFDVYARDAFNTTTGGIDLLTKDKQSTDLGGWIALSQQQVTVPANSGMTIPFSVTAPRTATPGDHDAGIVVSLVTASGTGPAKVAVDSRVGLRVYLRVTGPVTSGLVVDQIESAYSGTNNPIGKGELDVTYVVHNTGNIRLRGHQAIAVKGPFGITLATRELEDLPELLPGASATHTQHFTDVAPTFRVTTSVTVTPFAPPASGADAAGAEPSTGSSSVWAVPWTLLLLLVAMFVGWRVVRRSRRDRRKAAPSGGSKGSSGPRTPKDPGDPGDPHDPGDPGDGDPDGQAIELVPLDEIEIDDVGLDAGTVVAGAPADFT